MHITITCEECGHRHRLARVYFRPGPIYIVCHECEMPLAAELPADQIPSGSLAPEEDEPAGSFGPELPVEQSWPPPWLV